MLPAPDRNGIIEMDLVCCTIPPVISINQDKQPEGFCDLEVVSPSIPPVIVVACVNYEIFLWPNQDANEAIK